jgi:hypothetical protein
MAKAAVGGTSSAGERARLADLRDWGAMSEQQFQ